MGAETTGKKKESTFSKSLGNALKAESWFYQRIESGLTSRGIPDVYVVSPEEVPMWFELKQVNRNHLDGGLESVQWRLGQQNWLYNIMKKWGQRAYTLVRYTDGLLVIPHNMWYENGLVDTENCQWFKSLRQFALEFK